jgi:hypothetical protein
VPTAFTCTGLDGMSRQDSKLEKHLVLVSQIGTRLKQHAGDLCVTVLSRVHHSSCAVIVSRARICTCKNVGKVQTFFRRAGAHPQ